MTFPEAVNSAPSIQGHLKEGLQAIRKRDRHRVSCVGLGLSGSVDIDAALRGV